jgi:HAD superfamily hydrolase (TIGR01509 family)
VTTTDPTPLPFLPEALLFDMDGTLVDTEPLHFLSTNRVLAAHGKGEMTWEEFVPYIGDAEDPFWVELKARYGLSGTTRELAAARGVEFDALLRTRPVPLMAGSLELLSLLDEYGIPCAVASSTPREQIATVLEKAGLAPLVQAQVSGHDDVERGKPHPHVYFAAAEALGADVRRCVAVEDSANGAASAKAAGAFVVGVPGPLEGADMHLASLSELVELLR